MLTPAGAVRVRSQFSLANNTVENDDTLLSSFISISSEWSGFMNRLCEQFAFHEYAIEAENAACLNLICGNKVRTWLRGNFMNVFFSLVLFFFHSTGQSTASIQIEKPIFRHFAVVSSLRQQRWGKILLSCDLIEWKSCRLNRVEIRTFERWSFFAEFFNELWKLSLKCIFIIEL